MVLEGFQHVIFICHTPLVRGLANWILSVGDERVVVRNSEGDVLTDFPSVAPFQSPNKT
jgi:hypothetical protein